MKSGLAVYNKTFIILTGGLILVGLMAFFSGAFYLFSESSSAYINIVLRHVGLGIFGGVIGFGVVSFLNARNVWKIAPWVFGITLLLSALVYIPGVGTRNGGAALRWIEIGGASIQPGEFLKIGAVLGLAWIFSVFRDKVGTVKYGLVPFAGVLSIVGAILLFQPDTDGFLVIAVALSAMYFYAGASWKHILACIGVIVLLGGGLVMTRPYLRDRVKTFINPTADPKNSSWQVQQALTAIGSGGVLGRGYGKGIHKYEYLPEPMNDTLFAVVGEEMGILGTSLIVILFYLWYVKALVVAGRVNSLFSRVALVGFAHIILVQAYINILSNIGLFPFSGLPLPFMSQGGTALFVMLVIIGVMGSLTRTVVSKG